MKIIPVNDSQTKKQFLELPVEINKNNPEYIRPLDKDIEAVFDESQNKLFRRPNNYCERWLLKDDDGKVIGRIAAFVNSKYKSPGDTQPTGGIGFFECIDNQDAANILFNHAVVWLKDKGMEAMDGPINFGERDNWWGLVVEGFYEPLYGMNYNPPYYQTLFENYGFKPFFNQLCYALIVKNRIDEKHYIRHARITEDPDYHSEHLKINKLDKYAEDFCTVYNKAFAGHGGNKTMELRQAKKIFNSMKAVIDEEIVWYIYHKNEPIGIWLNIPDLNQWFKYMNGKFGLWQKLKFLFIKKTKRNKRFVGIVFGVVPEFQGKGADSYLILEGAKTIQGKALYDDYEMQWIGDFNPKMVSIAKSLGAHISRRLTTYRYLFDRNKEFKRHPMVG